MTAQDRDFSAAEIRAAFDAPAPLTVGIEEELMLLDPATGDLAPVAPSCSSGYPAIRATSSSCRPRSSRSSRRR